MKVPESKKINVIDKICGIDIADPYRWLEDGSNVKVRNWITAQNRYALLSLKKGTQKILLKELIKNFKVVNFSNPIPVSGKYFYVERQPREDQMVLYVKNSLNGKSIKLVDPNGKKKSNTIAIEYWFPSKTGAYVAYGLSKGGDEMATLYIIDANKHKPLREKIIRCRHSSVCWLPDDSGFFYTANLHPGAVPKNEEHLHSKVRFHKLGSDPKKDELIFGNNRPKDDMIRLSNSIDGKYLAIHVSRNWNENEVYIYDRKKRETIPLIIGMSAKFSLHFLENKAILYTNYKANNYRILSISLSTLFKNVDEWQEFFPEREHLLESVAITKDKVLLEYLVNVCSTIVVADHFGNETGKVPLPQYSSLAGISARRTEKEFFYGVESFTFPKIVYRFNPATGQSEKYKATDNPIKSDDYLVKQEWYASNDGTKVPLFIFHKKSVVLNGKNPTVLLGYGGFAISETPAFMRNWLPWLERDGVFAVANIRGGGEFGEKWHEDGIKEKKQNGFDDFICAAEFLISKKYADAKHLGIIGASNGGLLVSAVAVQRPDLFKAVCAKVPLTDMSRFHKFGIAIRWIEEYGNPDIKNGLKNILQWSPYHNIKKSIKYPNIFFTTANNDTRIDPLHARKLAALLQSVNQKNKILIFTEKDAGHGSGNPISKIIEVQSLILTFFSQELGLKI